MDTFAITSQILCPWLGIKEHLLAFALFPLLSRDISFGELKTDVQGASDPVYGWSFPRERNGCCGRRIGRSGLVMHLIGSSPKT